jgi:DNA polymerase (family 10)
VARLLEHARAVRAWRPGWPGLRLLAGADVAVRRDGSLALDDAVLAEFDVVTAVIRDHLDQPRTEMTRRIARAIENPHVDLLLLPAIHSSAHDLDAVIAAAKRTGTVLEIEARSDGLGLRSEDVRKALDAGVRLAIDSGAAEPDQLIRSAELGVALARRAWARRGDVLNAFPLGQCLCQLKDGRHLC